MFIVGNTRHVTKCSLAIKGLVNNFRRCASEVICRPKGVNDIVNKNISHSRFEKLQMMEFWVLATLEVGFLKTYRDVSAKCPGQFSPNVPV